MLLNGFIAITHRFTLALRVDIQEDFTERVRSLRQFGIPSFGRHPIADS